MKILAVAFAYNEAKYIEDFIKFYRRQGCDIYVADNHSTDGTTEILQKHKVKSDIVYTGGAFDLIKLQAALISSIKTINPDWVVYTGIDIRYCLEGTIKDEIGKVDDCNMIGVQHYNMYATGEKFELPMYRRFFYGRKGNRLYMIAKNEESLSFEADSIQLKKKIIYESDGCLLNYGNCKPAAEREDTYRRRQKAWDRGLDHNYGVHYKEGHTRCWLWDSAEMTDVRQTDHWKYISKL